MTRRALALMTLGALFCFPSVSAAADALPAGCHTITAEEQAGLQAMGAAIPSTGMFCDKDKPLLYGGCDENPYPYLQTKNKTGRADSVSGLNSDFACRMSKFFKAADAAGQKITIGSGYRSEQMQSGMYNAWIAGGKSGPPVAPPGRSKHGFGLAIDLNYNGTIGPRATAACIAQLPPCKWAHENYAQYGLRYPMEYEPWHIEPSGAVNGRQQPLPQGGWQGDQTSTPYTNTGAPYNPNTWNPSMAPQPQQFSPLGSGSTGTPYPTQITPTYPTNPNLPPNYDTIPLPSASSSVLTAPPPYLYPLSTTTARATSGPSVFDQIRLIARGTGESGSIEGYTTGTSSPTQLNGDLSDAGDSLTGVTNADDGGNLAIATTSVPLQPLGATNTFNDVTQIAPATSSANAANTSLIVGLLTALRDFLQSYLNFMRAHGSYGFEGAWRR